MNYDVFKLPEAQWEEKHEQVLSAYTVTIDL